MGGLEDTKELNLNDIENFENNKKQGKRKKRKISYAPLIFLFAFVAMLVCFSDDKIGLFGYTYKFIASDSMIPEINPNDLCIIKICKVDDVDIGDIICFHSDITTVHRVVEIRESDSGDRQLITKGDTNENNDTGVVTNWNLVGKVVYTIPTSKYVHLA